MACHAGYPIFWKLGRCPEKSGKNRENVGDLLKKEILARAEIHKQWVWMRKHALGALRKKHWREKKIGRYGEGAPQEIFIPRWEYRQYQLWKLSYGKLTEDPITGEMVINTELFEDQASLTEFRVLLHRARVNATNEIFWNQQRRPYNPNGEKPWDEVRLHRQQVYVGAQNYPWRLIPRIMDGYKVFVARAGMQYWEYEDRVVFKFPNRLPR